jgi:hypothetical protein
VVGGIRFRRYGPQGKLHGHLVPEPPPSPITETLQDPSLERDLVLIRHRILRARLYAFDVEVHPLTGQGMVSDQVALRGVEKIHRHAPCAEAALGSGTSSSDWSLEEVF